MPIYKNSGNGRVLWFHINEVAHDVVADKQALPREVEASVGHLKQVTLDALGGIGSEIVEKEIGEKCASAPSC